MPIDFSSCEIRTPEKPHELRRLFEMLAEAFPVEKKLFQDIISGNRTLYKWQPHTLYHGDDPIGNVSTVMFQLQAENRVQEIAGIASVATPERYRGMGIAKYLMNHVLKAIDEQNLPGILFTSLPQVYTGLGYNVVEQIVKQTVASKVKPPPAGLTVRRLTQLNSDDLAAITKLYSETFSYDGKLLRNEEYWRLYCDAVNNSDDTEFVFCRSGDEVVGYARLEYEADRVLVDEFYVNTESREINAALWNHVCDAEEEKGKILISIAVPSTHGLWNFLQLNGLPLEPETGIEREAFMVRMPKMEPIKWLTGLRWSLSDKF